MADRDAKPREDLREARMRARLAWNNWPDTEDSRRQLVAHEERDPFSACAWDRVVIAIRELPVEDGARSITMPILGPHGHGDLPQSVTWKPIEADRKAAIRNHGRTLERLVQRGGVSWCELASIVADEHYVPGEEPLRAKSRVFSILIQRSQ